VVLSALALALCLAGAMSVGDGCSGWLASGRCRLVSGVQKLWKLGHRTLLLVLFAFGLGALTATASSCSASRAEPYLPVTDVQAEPETKDAKGGVDKCRLCKVRMGVFTCTVFATVGTLAWTLFHAYKGTCQLAADLQELRIIYITRAQPRNYGKRLQGQLDTWMDDISREDLLVTSFVLQPDKKLSERDRQSVMEFNCPDNHALGVCCVEANALIQMENRTFDWVFIVDDDVYVVVENLRRVLARLHPRSELQTEALGYGITGCVTKGRPCGFCGGGGYALSYKAVKVLLGNDTRKFFKRYMRDCENTKYCDVTTECLAVENGTKVHTMHGLHPWRVGNPTWNLTALEGFFHAPGGGQLQECPISFHYVQESKTMKKAHDLAKKYVPAFGMASSQAADGFWC
ncbi:ZRANB3, partial [Symbiodinium natans]